MTAISKQAKRKGLFQDSYARDYALRVTERHTHTRQVLLVRCLFCIYVGRGQKPCEERVRQSTINSKNFRPLFRPELFKDHHERQHLSIWQQYQSTPDQEKSTFFDDYTTYANTLFPKFEPAQTPFTFDIERPLLILLLEICFFTLMTMPVCLT